MGERRLVEGPIRPKCSAHPLTDHVATETIVLIENGSGATRNTGYLGSPVGDAFTVGTDRDTLVRPVGGRFPRRSLVLKQLLPVSMAFVSRLDA